MVTLSRIPSPVLCAIIALVAFPLAVSTVITQTPLPVIFARFAWYGYSGKGALTAMACAADNDNEVAIGRWLSQIAQPPPAFLREFYFLLA